MGTFLLGVVTIIYVSVAMNYWWNGQNGMAVAFAAYALANIGFIIAGQEGLQ